MLDRRSPSGVKADDFLRRPSTPGVSGMSAPPGTRGVAVGPGVVGLSATPPSIAKPGVGGISSSSSSSSCRLSKRPLMPLAYGNALLGNRGIFALALCSLPRCRTLSAAAAAWYLACILTKSFNVRHIVHCMRAAPLPYSRSILKVKCRSPSFSLRMKESEIRILSCSRSTGIFL